MLHKPPAAQAVFTVKVTVEVAPLYWPVPPMLAANTAVPKPSICTRPVVAFTVATSVFELKKVIAPARLDDGGSSVKSALPTV